MISCQEADVLAAALSVGSVDNGDQRDLQQHLSRCRDCRRLAGEYMEAAARLPLALTPVQPSPELRGRLMRAVYAEAARDKARGSATAAPSWWDRLWAGVPASRGLTMVGAVATAAMIAVTSWTATHRATAPVAPGVDRIALAATPAAPDAHGQLVVMQSARRAVLTVSGLPGPGAAGPVNRVYEVWLLRPNGAAVAAAYLTQAPDGSWTAAMRGDMSGYSAVAATIEPAGGSLTPTGTKVLEGFLGPPPTGTPPGGSS